MKHRSLLIVLLIAYLAVLFALTLLPPRYPAQQRVHLVPFYMIIRDIYWGGWRFLINTLGNIAAFVPLGVLVPLIWRRRWSFWTIAFCGFSLSFVIEVLQFLFTQRVADVDDLTLNTLGALVGYGCYLILIRLRDRHFRAAPAPPTPRPQVGDGSRRPR